MSAGCKKEAQYGTPSFPASTCVTGFTTSAPAGATALEQATTAGVLPACNFQLRAFGMRYKSRVPGEWSVRWVVNFT